MGTMTAAAGAITHTGATSFTISITGTDGTVTVESVNFDGGAMSGVTTIDAATSIKVPKVIDANGDALTFGGSGAVTVAGVLTATGAQASLAAVTASGTLTMTAAAGAIT